MMPVKRSVSTETRSGCTSSLIEMRGRSSRAPVSVAARAIFSARISTVDPSTPSTSMRPFVLPILTSPPAASGYDRVHSSVARAVKRPSDRSQAVRATAARMPNISRGERRADQCVGVVTRTPSGEYIRNLERSVQLDGDQFRDAGLLHRHAVETVGNLHGLAIVRDHDELRVLLHAAEHFHEAADVG